MDNLMFDYIPSYFKNAKNFAILMNSENIQLDKADALIDDLIDQLYVDTATWGLIYWEKEHGIEYNPMLSYEERRSRVKAKIRGIGKVDRKLIQAMAAAYSNGEVDVTFDGKINVTFIGTRGIPSALAELKNQLEEIKPSGLPIVYIFTYLTWYEFDLLTAEAQESMTWDQLESYKP